MNRIICFAFLVSGIAVSGCGGASDAPELATVEGTVTWQGKPLVDAGVAFTPESGPVAIGRTDETGHFTLSTQGRPGAKVGAHRITIDAYEASPKGAAGGIDSDRSVALVSRIPAKFSDLTKSGLDGKVSAKDSENNFELHLK